MGVSEATLRYVTFGVSVVNYLVFLFVFAAPFWRTTSNHGTIQAYSNVYGYQGLWMECVSFYRQTTQCFEIGVMTPYQTGSSNTRWPSSYFQYGIYSYLNAFRALMIIALVSSTAALGLALTGLKCSKFLKEGGRGKRWVNIAAGACHITSGVLTGISVSWYAAEVVHEYYSPYYQTTRIKYTLGACLFMGWISMVLSLGAGCILTCCTCFNSPVDRSDAIVSRSKKGAEMHQVVESVKQEPLIYTPRSNYNDEHDGESTRYVYSQKSHKSHKSHRSHHSRKGDLDDDYHHRDYYVENSTVDGFV